MAQISGQTTNEKSARNENLNETSNDSVSNNHIKDYNVSNVNGDHRDEVNLNLLSNKVERNDNESRSKLYKLLVNPKIFLLNFSFIGILRVAYFTYLISIMSTLEKRYAFPSKLSAFILIADNISGMIMSPIVGYFGTKFNGPKLIGYGMMLVSLSCYLSGLPYLIYGASTHLIASSNATDFSSSSSSLSSVSRGKIEKYDTCGSSVENCDLDNTPFEFGAYIILWIASFVNGLGYTTFWTIGIPYIDNNVKKKNSPIYLSTSTVMRLTGVTVGFFLSSFALSFYENPTYKINLPRKDPRWIGAWWMGFFFFGTTILLSSLPMFWFPASMKNKYETTKKLKPKPKHSISDAFGSFKRVITNPVVVFDTVGGGIRYIGLAGYWITKPRYIEAQFSQSASSANFLTGATSTIMKAFGILLGGVFISKYKPNPRLLVGLVVIVELTCNVLMFSSMFFGCEPAKFDHFTFRDNKLDLESECNRNCDCTTKVFQPVCDQAANSHYFSPCFAGCQTVNVTAHTFSDCNCLANSTTLKSGYCENDCDALPKYLTVVSLAGIVSSLARTANLIIALRAVEPRDKTFAIGLISSYMALFVFIPYPIVYGFIIDSACLIWEKTCGETGNCWFYDIDKLRYRLHGITFVLSMIGSLFDFATFVYANRIKRMYDDDDEDEDDEREREEIEEKEVHLQ